MDIEYFMVCLRGFGEKEEMIFFAEDLSEMAQISEFG